MVDDTQPETATAASAHQVTPTEAVERQLLH
jgi:hypothetical protein